MFTGTWGYVTRLLTSLFPESDEESPSDLSDESHSDGDSEGETDLQVCEMWWNPDMYLLKVLRCVFRVYCYSLEHVLCVHVFQFHDTVPCKFYNSGSCRDGNRCSYLHICKYALKGNCRYGSKCKLNHNVDGIVSSRANRPVDQPQHDGRSSRFNLKKISHKLLITSAKDVIGFYVLVCLW